ncbi:hypothetical protein BKI52_22260 [marine bacterium AO1-C]|nr:hypothetical protein BKI52_22260 [marine bacterium AO1-C]
MKYFLAFICLGGFFQHNWLIAQNPNTVETVVKAGEKALQAHQMASAMDYFSEALSNPVIKNIPKIHIKALKHVAHLYNIKGMYDRGFQQYLQALAIAEKTNDSAQQSLLFGDIANVYFQLKNYNKALEYVDRGLAIAIQQKLLRVQKPLLTIKGIIHVRSGQPDKAIVTEEKALKIAETLNDTIMFAKVHNNLAYFYTQMGNYPKAKKHFFKAIRIKHDNAELRANARSNLADLYREQGKYDSALVYLNQAIGFAQTQPADWFLGVMYNKVARIYHLKKAYDTAESYYNKSMTILGKTEDPLGAVQTYGGIAVNYAAQKQFEKAYEAHKVFKMASDSLYRQQKLEYINGLEQTYVNAQKQKTITQLKQKATLQGRLLLTVVVILGLLLALFVLIVHRNKLKRTLLEQKSELLARENAFNKSEAQRLEVEQQLRQQENQRLKLDLDYKSRELTSSALLTYQNVEVLNNIQEILKDFKYKLPKNNSLQDDLKQIQHIIKNNTQIEKSWDRFKLHFDKVHPDFFDKLLGASSSLSQNDLRLSAYIRLNMSNKEIAQLLNIEFSSVQMAKYRLKKKLALSKDSSLNEFIQQL